MLLTATLVTAAAALAASLVAYEGPGLVERALHQGVGGAFQAGRAAFA
jgi:hypothetical protein